MNRSAILALAALAASPLRAQEAAPEARPCTATAPGAVLAGWKEVRGDGFTFCVPAEWSPAGRAPREGTDPRRWRGPSGSVSWTDGQTRRREVVTTTVRTMTTSSGMGGVALQDVLPLSPPGLVRLPENVGGFPAELWRNEMEGRFSTGASWAGPRRATLEGEARDRATADLQLQVYRTVRFAPR